MMSLTLSGQTVQLFFTETLETFIFTPEHPAYKTVKDELKKGSLTVDGARAYFNRFVAKNVALVDYTQGNIQLIGTDVFYKSKKLENSAVECIRDFHKEGLPVKGLLNFLNRLYSLNPSKWVVEGLFDFIRARGMVILDDGSFVGYKGVCSDFLDKFSRTIDNSPGSFIPPFNRNEVDDDKQKECSFGYHMGTLDYARSYAGRSGRIVLCKAAPEDVVSVPSDYSAKKIRVCWYQVLSEYKDKKVLEYRACDNDMKRHPTLPYEREVVDEEGWGFLSGVDSSDENEYTDGLYGVKPEGGMQAGRKYYNYRKGGKFARKED